MKISIIGTGLQFSRRASVIINSKDDKLISICGKNLEKAKRIAKKYNCNVDTTWQDTIKRNNVDAIIIATPPDLHKKIAIEALKSGKHVLCEKPLSKSIIEAKTMHKMAKNTGLVLKCGFNLRHHPAMIKAYEIVKKKKIGKLTFGRAVFGICGRPEYEKEWRANPKNAAGGQFIEQGSHLIDLLRWYFGEIKYVASMISKDYFNKQKLDDGGFCILRFKNGSSASMHTSLAQWINTFSFEIYGTNGYIRIEGLGGGYGEQKLYIGKKDFNAPFKEEITYFRGPDKSWINEWKEFKNSIFKKKTPIGDSFDGLQVMKIAKSCYLSNTKKKFITI